MTMPQPKTETISAFFDTEAKVQEALTRLGRLGVPRDLIDVLLGPEAAKQFYRGRTQGAGSRMVAYAGLGAVLGFLVSAVLSFGIILWPGFAGPGLAAMVQLLGPNMGTMLGATIGAGVGYFIRRRPHGVHLRALGRPEIFIVVRHRPPATPAEIEQALIEAGGEQVVCA